MPKLLIHAGLPKTGSTALQIFLFDNKENLSDNGWLYPLDLMSQAVLERAAKQLNVPNGNAGAMVGSLLPDDYRYSNPQNREKSFEAFEKILQESNNSDLLFSAEAFWAIDITFWERINALCKKYGYTLGILIYLRQQDDWFESLYLQRLKNFDLPADLIYPEAYYSQITHHSFGFFEKQMFDIENILSKLCDLVGESQFILKCYEKAQFKNGNIFDDFWSTLDLPEIPLKYPETIINPSPSPNYIAFLQRLSLIDDLYSKFEIKKELDDILGQTSSYHREKDVSYLPLQLKNKILEDFSAINGRIAEKYFPKSHEMLFTTRIDAATHHEVVPDPMMSFDSAILMQLLLNIKEKSKSDWERQTDANTNQRDQTKKLNEQRIKQNEHNRKHDAHVIKLNEQNAKQNESIRHINEHSKKLSANIEQLREHNRKCDAELEELNEHSRKHYEDTQQLNEHGRKHDADIQQLNEHSRKHDADIQQLNEHSRKHDADIHQLNEHSRKHDADIQQLNEDGRKHDEPIRLLNEHNRKLDTEIQQLNELLKQHSRYSSDLEKQIENHENRLRQETEKITQKLNGLKQINKDLKAEITHVRQAPGFQVATKFYGIYLSIPILPKLIRTIRALLKKKDNV